MREWDPIGISDYPDAPDDEYDSYATRLCGGLIDRTMTETHVAAYLGEIAEKRMGLRADIVAAQRAAHAIIALRKEFGL